MKVACLWFEKPAPVVRVAEQCLRFSPQICFRTEHAVFIEIGKCHRLYSEEGFLARLKVVLRRMQLDASIAIGKDIGDSLLMAKHSKPRIDALPLMALLDLADPFDRDPVIRKYVLRLITSFQDLGIRTLHEFRSVPTSELTTRFGPVGILCKQRLSGELNFPWPQWKPEDRIFEKSEFPYFEFYGELEPILFELKKHLDQIFQRLWARDLKAQTMQVRIHCERTSLNPEPYRRFDFDFLLPQSATKGALNIIKERLSRDFQRDPITSPIEGIETLVTSTAPGGMGQKNFLHQREETAEQLSSLLGQLAEAHGRENIFQAELTEERLPEKSWKKSFAVSMDEPKTRTQISGRIPRRPTYLIKPMRIEITGGYVHILKKSFKIVHRSSNVERLTGGWLENNQDLFSLTHSRDYFHVEIESGTTLAIFQTPKNEHFLHGYFG